MSQVLQAMMKRTHSLKGGLLVLPIVSNSSKKKSMLRFQWLTMMENQKEIQTLTNQCKEQLPYPQDGPDKANICQNYTWIL